MGLQKQLNLLAGQTANVLNLRAERQMREQTRQMQEQRIRAEQAFKLKLQSLDNAAADARQRQKQHYESGQKKLDRDVDREKIGAQKASNSLKAKENLINEKSNAINRASLVYERLYGTRIRSNDAQIRLLYDAMGDPYNLNKPTMADILSLRAQNEIIMREGKDMLNQALGNISPLIGQFEFPQKIVQPKHKKVELSESEKEAWASFNSGKRSNTIDTGWTATDDSSKASLKPSKGSKWDQYQR